MPVASTSKLEKKLRSEEITVKNIKEKHKNQDLAFLDIEVCRGESFVIKCVENCREEEEKKIAESEKKILTVS